MKKIAIVVMMLTFVLTACGGGGGGSSGDEGAASLTGTPTELYTQAMEALKAAFVETDA